MSPASLEIYAREACIARPEDQIALVAEASTSESPLDTPQTQVVGLVGLLLDDGLKPPEMKLDGCRTGYVTNLAVATPRRGEGVGGALLLAAEEACGRAGCETGRVGWTRPTWWRGPCTRSVGTRTSQRSWSPKRWWTFEG